MKDDKKIYKFMVLVVGVMALVSIGSLSFAYFTTQIEEGTVYSMKGKAKSTGYHISFSETSSGVSLENTYPMPDEMGLQLDPYTFTVTNDETDYRINVDVILEVLENSDLEDTLVNVAIDGTTKTLDSELQVDASESGYKSAYKIYTFSLNPGESRTYDLRTWINSDGTLANAQNKKWASRVLVAPRD